jgi:hypothetical protein
MPQAQRRSSGPSVAISRWCRRTWRRASGSSRLPLPRAPSGPAGPGNPPSRGVVSLSYRRGLERITITTRLRGDGRWRDPFAVEGVPAMREQVRLDRGTARSSIGPCAQARHARRLAPLPPRDDRALPRLPVGAHMVPACAGDQPAFLVHLGACRPEGARSRRAAVEAPPGDGARPASSSRVTSVLRPLQGDHEDLLNQAGLGI